MGGPVPVSSGPSACKHGSEPKGQGGNTVFLVNTARGLMCRGREVVQVHIQHQPLNNEKFPVDTPGPHT